MYRLPGAESLNFIATAVVEGLIDPLPPPRTEPGLPVLSLKPRGSPLSRSKFVHRATVVMEGFGVGVRRIPATVRLGIGVGAILFAANAMHFIPAVKWPKQGVSSLRPAVKPWTKVNAQFQRRAAVEFRDDFRHGLEAWTSRSGAPAPWSFDGIGFVHPARLALYRPTLELTDYVFNFSAQVDRQAIGFVFRASDFENYYAVKLVVAQPGPLPRVEVVRYSVIKGHEGPHTAHTLPLTVHSDTTYQVRMEIRGSDFTLITQGKVADQWSDSRLARGGIGFFCGKGDQARLQRVEVSHQNDTWGRLCAYIAPVRQPAAALRGGR